MTDDGAEAGHEEPDDVIAAAEAARPEVDVQFVDRLPGGRVVMPMEADGRFSWLIVRGHMSPQARREMLSELRQIVGSGLWVQNWRPPQAGR